jgi:hypothetical protein
MKMGLEFRVSYQKWMREWFNAPNNMDEWMVWHIMVVAMWEIQILNYSLKLFEIMSICIVES